MSRTAVTVRTAPAIDASARRQHRLCLRECRRPAAACVHLQPTHRCPALDSPLQSAASSTTSTATIGGKVAAAFFTAASFFPTNPCSSRCRCCCRGSLRGGVEVQGGDPGSCGGASARRLPSGGSGGPPALLRRLRRRFAAHRRVSTPSHGAAEKSPDIGSFFSRLRQRMRRACVQLERANLGLSNGIGVSGGPV